MPSRGFHWKSEALFRNVHDFPKALDRAVTSATEYGATFGESHMRANAPWTDRTGAARATLSATASHNPGKSHSIILSHGVHYGIWLEVKHSGRYAIVVPSLTVVGRKVMGLIDDLLSRRRV